MLIWILCHLQRLDIITALLQDLYVSEIKGGFVGDSNDFVRGLAETQSTYAKNIPLPRSNSSAFVTHLPK